MPIGMLILTVAAVLIFFGVAQRVLDRMHLTDRQALLIVAAMFAGTLIPSIPLGPVAVNIGGALIPLGVCVYLLIRADERKEVVRSLVGAVLTGAILFAMAKLLPDEPEEMAVEPNLLYGLVGGAVAYLLGRSRRCAFICGIVGMLLADTATAVENWSRGIDQTLVLGGAGLADSVVISGFLAVLLAELVGEVLERIARRRQAAARKEGRT